MIIAHSPTIKEDGCVPRRIVIRDVNGAYVVHNQQFKSTGGHSSFSEGTYFDKLHFGVSTTPETDKKNLARAWKCFDRRSRQLLGIE